MVAPTAGEPEANVSSVASGEEQPGTASPQGQPESAVAPLPEQQRESTDPTEGAPQLSQDGGIVFDSTDVVVGVPIADNGMRRLVRRVIVLAAMGATFFICDFIVMLMTGQFDKPNQTSATALWTPVSALLIELSIPACGYTGALYSNRQMTCCFCSCNLFIGVVAFMSFLRRMIRFGEIKNCQQEKQGQERKICEDWVSDGAEKYLVVGRAILVIGIGTLAFWFGSNLYSRLGQDFMLSMPPARPLVGEVIAMSPQVVPVRQVATTVVPSADSPGPAGEQNPSTSIEVGLADVVGASSNDRPHAHPPILV